MPAPARPSCTAMGSRASVYCLRNGAKTFRAAASVEARNAENLLACGGPSTNVEPLLPSMM